MQRITLNLAPILRIALLVAVGLSAADEPAAGESDRRPVADALQRLDAAKWIGAPAEVEKTDAAAGPLYFRHTFVIPYELDSEKGRIDSVLWVAARASRIRVFANGVFLFDETALAGKLFQFDKSYFNPGRNSLAVEIEPKAGRRPALIATVRAPGGQVVCSDSAWQVSTREAAGWRTQFFDDAAWAKAVETVGEVPAIAQLVQLPRHVYWPIASEGMSSGSPYKNLHAGLWPESPKGLPVASDEAQRLLQADWLFQAYGKPTPARSLKEIGWARKLATRLKRDAPALDLSAELRQLGNLEKRLQTLPPDALSPQAETLYFEVRRIKRRITLRNPVLDFNQILCLDGGLTSGHESGSHRAGGRRLLLLSGFDPDAQVEVLAQGSINRYDLSFDARRIVYGNGGSLFEMVLDGEGTLRGTPRRLTNSPFMDVEPIYLPDGHIMFRTERAQSFVRCHDHNYTAVLARCDADGKNIYIISHNSEPDFTPCLLPDGRVLYTRWEYSERPLWRLQKLWTMNPDGTNVAHYWGNRSLYVDVAWEARSIPGTQRVMFTGSGHHIMRPGCIGVIDVSEGRDWPDGIWKVTMECEWPESGDEAAGDDPYEPKMSRRTGRLGRDRPVVTSDRPYSPHYHASGPFEQYRTPYPLGPEDFLVSAAATPYDHDVGLYLMDIHGNKELLFRGPSHIWCAAPLRPRPRPPIIPDRAAWPKANETPAMGVLHNLDVYHKSGIPRGKVKYLRVVELIPKTYRLHTRIAVHTTPGISLVQSDLTKRFLGTAPVAPDGSVCFEVPPGKAMLFQLLDEQYRCLQVMRSFTGVMPGEVRSCTGCHEQQDATPYGAAPARYSTPVALTPPPWGDETIGYERFCQRVLDEHCGKCHQRDGEARAKLDLTLRGGHDKEIGVTDPKMYAYKEPYPRLLGWVCSPGRTNGRTGAGIAGAYPVEADLHFSMRTQPPMMYLSYGSPLIALATSGKHHGVKVQGEDLHRLIAWVDSNCVYRGMEEVRQLPENLKPNYLTRSAPIVDRLCPVTDPVQRQE